MATATAKKPKTAAAKAKAGTPAQTATKAKAKLKVDESLYRVEVEIQEWDVSKITKSPYDERIDELEKSPELLSLASSLKRGQLNPLLIRPSGEHIAGWRRVRAARLAGIKTLQVRLVHCDDLTARLLVFEENEKRKPLTEREQCNAYNAMLKAYIEAGKTQKQLAADLSIDHTTLSNKTRLKSLSHDSWVLFEDGWLSLDQIRQLATHAMVTGFESAALDYIEKQLKGGTPPLPKFAFDNAMTAGFQTAYRPLAQSQGCSFKVKDDQKKLLGVTTVEHPHYGKIEVATNVEKWEELKAEDAAKQQKKEEKSKATEAAKPEAVAPKPMKEPAKVQKVKTEEKRLSCLLSTWLLAYATAIRSKFDNKVKAKDQWQVIRLGVLVQQCTPEPEHLSLDVLMSEETDFVSEMLTSVRGFFSPATTEFANNYEVLSREELKQIAGWLGVLPGDFWRPDAELLKTCNDFELLALRDELELEEALEDKNRADLTERILRAWDEGGPGVSWCPKMFEFGLVDKA